MTTFTREFMIAAKEAPRLYFAVLVGAVRGAREEWNRVIAESRNPQTTDNPSNTNPKSE
jgi:hypothetical protein